ncbi:MULTISPECIES: late competence development ComFB family protein [Vibrio]|uniref:Competence protein ComFB n=2 Tax=Vibrio TaxID=662 RepID=A0A7X4LK08_9VIBR|nr:MULTISPECIES: late competence development ComFB family protein [Vibrio]MBF9002626.1 late competence development ComFB family protein [Vibrio nitrifigilis]MZI93390.1 competence protein ComFB [Vibrio eleionomae]
MQISNDVHNYMETLVGQALHQEEFEHYDEEQLADLACLALNQLRPVYIRYDIDFLSSLPEDRLVMLKRNADVAISTAESMILEDRRKNRHSDVPSVIRLGRFDEDRELEWYETPLLKSKDHS